MELVEEEDDLAGLAEEAERLEADLGDLYRETLLSGDHVDRAAIVTIKPGAGGTESSDWSGILLRMYRRYAERNGFKVEFIDVESNEARSEERRVGKEGRARRGRGR